ncbi:hypothetical protein FB451DRAFT_1050365, partial [Mycena latifolia]
NYAANKSLLESTGIVTEAYSSLSSVTKIPGGPVDAPVAAGPQHLRNEGPLAVVRAKGRHRQVRSSPSFELSLLGSVVDFAFFL